MTILKIIPEGRELLVDEPSARIELRVHRGCENKTLRLVDDEGKVYGEAGIMFRYPMPEGFDVEVESRRAKSGGCCGKTAE